MTDKNRYFALVIRIPEPQATERFGGVLAASTKIGELFRSLAGGVAFSGLPGLVQITRSIEITEQGATEIWPAGPIRPLAGDIASVEDSLKSSPSGDRIEVLKHMVQALNIQPVQPNRDLLRFIVEELEHLRTRTDESTRLVRVLREALAGGV